VRKQWKNELTNVFITGAGGYLGGAIATELEKAGHNVTRGLRRPLSQETEHHANIKVHGELALKPAWGELLPGHDVVIHCAGPAHVSKSDHEKGRKVITQATSVLAQAAANHGIKRFIFMSSAHVMGLSSPEGHPLNEQDEIRPATTYAIAKREAELEGCNIAAKSGMIWIALRPPMVYGPHCPGNFSRLLSLVKTGMPLPFGSATAAKSFICVANLTSAVKAAVEHRGFLQESYLIADNESSCTKELLQMIAGALGKRAPVLVSIPAGAMLTAARLTGRGRDVERLFARCELSNAKFCSHFGWSPPMTLENGIKAAVRTDG